MPSSRTLLWALLPCLALACSTSDTDDGDGGAASTGSGGAGGGLVLGPGGGGSAPEDLPAIAPPDANAGEEQGLDGDNEVFAGEGADAVFRVESAPGEHVHFWLSFADAPGLLELSIERWNGEDIDHVGTTDAGHGLRTLAIFDPDEPRTYWARVHTDAPVFEGTLTVTRTPFADASSCADDCERLLQLPLPLDSAFEGYATAPTTVFRYQFGRRDLVMLLRYAARTMAYAGHAPFVPEDLSQWDGETPGSDVGAPRHASHRRGRDVDISLYGSDGLAPWRSYCETVNDGAGRECLPGTVHDFDGAANAEMYAGFLQSGRVTMSFLDAELIGPVIDGAELAAADGAIPPGLVPLYGDGVHLQHWPNHDNHIHVRVSEGASLQPEPVEPP